MKRQYQIEERIPTLEEYRKLCEAVGWGQFVNFEAAPIALLNSVYSVVAVHQEEIVGMGRIVGDGGIFYYIQDVVVLPTFQGQGIGHALMEQLVNYVGKNGPEKAFLGLFAAEGKEAFYKRYGFEQHRGGMSISQGNTPMTGLAQALFLTTISAIAYDAALWERYAIVTTMFIGAIQALPIHFFTSIDFNLSIEIKP